MERSAALWVSAHSWCSPLVVSSREWICPPQKPFLPGIGLIILSYQCCGFGSGSGSECFWAFWIRIHLCELRIRLRTLPLSSKNSKKNLKSYCLWLLYDFLSLKNDVNVASKSNKQKNLKKIILVGILKVADEKTRSVSQRGGRAIVCWLGRSFTYVAHKWLRVLLPYHWPTGTWSHCSFSTQTHRFSNSQPANVAIRVVSPLLITILQYLL